MFPHTLDETLDVSEFEQFKQRTKNETLPVLLVVENHLLLLKVETVQSLNNQLA